MKAQTLAMVFSSVSFSEWLHQPTVASRLEWSLSILSPTCCCRGIGRSSSWIGTQTVSSCPFRIGTLRCPKWSQIRSWTTFRLVASSRSFAAVLWRCLRERGTLGSSRAASWPHFAPSKRSRHPQSRQWRHRRCVACPWPPWVHTGRACKWRQRCPGCVRAATTATLLSWVWTQCHPCQTGLAWRLSARFGYELHSKGLIGHLEVRRWGRHRVGLVCLHLVGLLLTYLRVCSFYFVDQIVWYLLPLITKAWFWSFFSD